MSRLGRVLMPRPGRGRGPTRGRGGSFAWRLARRAVRWVADGAPGGRGGGLSLSGCPFQGPGRLTARSGLGPRCGRCRFAGRCFDVR